MAVFRLILLVSVLGGLTLLLAQNWTPAVALVFLGLQTQPLPLAMWILLSAVAGAFTSLAIASLFNLSGYFGEAPQRVVNPSRTKSSRTDRNPRDTSKGEPFPRRPVTPPRSNPKDIDDGTDDDWDFEQNTRRDWDFETSGGDDYYPQDSQPQDTKDYKSPRNNRPEAESDSTYSYSREPKSRVANESVYDADYRVIVPPSAPDTTNKTDIDADTNDDDWSFFEEEEDQGDRQQW